jgi:hypothetical protein
MERLMRRIGAAGIALALATPAVLADSNTSTQSRGIWRVVVLADMHYGRVGGVGLDSFSVEGNFEDCERIVKRFGSALPMPAGAKGKFYCLNTSTGALSPIAIN